MDKKQLKYDTAYLKMAQEWAKLSHCDRKQVGALIVKDKNLSSTFKYGFCAMACRKFSRTLSLLLYKHF